MNTKNTIWRAFLLCVVGYLALPVAGFAQSARDVAVVEAPIATMAVGAPIVTMAAGAPVRACVGVQYTDTPRDGQHDFDLEIGTWKTHLKRRMHPLAGSTTWVEYDGVTVVHKIWNGKANMVELDATGPAGHFVGLNLRLYNPQSHQWSLNFASPVGGSFGVPTIGEFKDGRGEFIDQETFNDRMILVRFVITMVTPDSWHFEQAFSDDEGKTWEINWIADDTRTKD
jgi:hypothetical protein